MLRRPLSALLQQKQGQNKQNGNPGRMAFLALSPLPARVRGVLVLLVLPFRLSSEEEGKKKKGLEKK